MYTTSTTAAQRAQACHIWLQEINGFLCILSFFLSKRRHALSSRRPSCSELAQLFWVFFKIGLSTFGGGVAMLPLLKRLLCEHKKWVDEEELVNCFADRKSVV